MMRAIALALMTALPLCALAQGDPVVLFETNDPQMAAARAEARDSLPIFLENVLQPDGLSRDGASVKVAMPTGRESGMGIENIWVGPFLTLDGQDFAGLLANEPNALDGLAYGDKVAFDRDMIVDWSFAAEDGTLYGNYTTRLVVERLPSFEARPIRERLPGDPVPLDWRRLR